jgi:hypothetical protein
MQNDGRQWIQERTAVLEGSIDPEELDMTATELASSDDPNALEALAAFLRRRDFLDRLDAPDSHDQTQHLRDVLAPLVARPGPEVARACLELVDEPLYMENDRKALILEALAAVVPMTPETAEAFRRANDEGYFGFDALLLARNGSFVAIELYRSMMSDNEVDAESRVELLHKGILPYRTNLVVLQAASGIMDAGLEEMLTNAAIESVFDYKTEWFMIHGPTPPAWRTASDDVLKYVVELGNRLKGRANLSAALLPAIQETTELALALLNHRAARRSS